MANLNNPSPQWTEPAPSASLASRLVPVRAGSGWVLRPAGVADGTFVRDPTTLGVTIATGIVAGLKPTKLPSGGIVIY